MSRRKIIFRADASTEIGYGHFIRCISLASMLKDDFTCMFATRNPDVSMLESISRAARYVTLPSDDRHFEYFLDMLEGDEIVFLDNYFFTSGYQKAIKDKGCALAVIDDMHSQHNYADVVINQNPVSADLFSVEPYCRLCLGLEWVLLRDEFLSPRPASRGTDVTVFFGGADPFGVTSRVLTLVREAVGASRRINAIAGNSVQLPAELPQGISIVRNASASDIVALFDSSAYAVLCSSTVCYEALSRALPVIVGWHVDNQRSFYGYVSSLAGAVPVGDLRNIDERILGDAIMAVQTLSPDVNLRYHSIFTGARDRYVSLFKSIGE